MIFLFVSIFHVFVYSVKIIIALLLVLILPIYAVYNLCSTISNLSKKNYSFYWVITSCRVKSEKEAELQLINDFGSEDLSATLLRKNDSIYVLRQDKGSTLKVPTKGKWQKLPKTLEFKKRKEIR